MPRTPCQLERVLLHLGRQHAVVEPEVHSCHVVGEVGVQDLKLVVVAGIQVLHNPKRSQVACKDACVLACV